jgi:type I restriction enzyme M protein
MDKPLSKQFLSDAIRATGLHPASIGTTLSLMLLWSQVAESKLRALPALKDASAEFIIENQQRIEKSLCPELAMEISRPLFSRRPGDLDIMRRAMMNALDSGLPVEAIAEMIFEHCAAEAWAPKEHADFLVAALGTGKDERVRCAFSYALRAAWTLSKQAAVDLDVDNSELVPVLSILSLTCGRALHVRPSTIQSVANSPGQLGEADHALIIPPIGMRLRLDHPSAFYLHDAAGEQLSAETFAALWGARLGRKRNIVVVGNGLLFRTSSRDAAFKQSLIHDHGLESIISLPRGMFPGSAISMSALVFSGQGGSKHRKEAIRFIDASDPAVLDPATLGKLVARKVEHRLCVDSSFQELLEAGFNLSVDRYVLDPETRRNRQLLHSHETVELSDLADIRRPQALPRESGKEKAFEVREALLADIDGGRLLLPAKLSQLPLSAAPKIESATLKPGDILLSIKGTIGKIALVTEDAIAESSPVPIVPGQSFVILRLRKGGAIREPQVLVSYLRSPLAQSLLQGMAGGTTIPNVAMGGLKGLPVPVLPMQTQQAILHKYNECQEMQKTIDKLRRQMKNTEEQIYSIALGGK